MESTLLKPLPGTMQFAPGPLKVTVSFAPYVAFLEALLAVSNGMKASFYRIIIRRFKQHPELLQPIADLSLIANYQELLHLVDATIFPLVHDAKENMMAFTPPLSTEMFYYSQSMYNTIVDKKTGFIKELHKGFSSEEQLRNRKMEFIYNFILEQYYDVQYDYEHSMVCPILDETTGLMKYYNLKMDKRFIRLSHSGELPEIDTNSLVGLRGGIIDVKQLQALIPLKLFSLDGFAVLHVEEITSKQALEQIKNTVLGINELSEAEVFDYINESLKNLLQEQDLEIGLLPFLKVNDTFIVDQHSDTRSILLKRGCNLGSELVSYREIASSYEHNPQPILISNFTTETLASMPMLEQLYHSGVRSYLVLPLYNNGKILGVLEMASLTADVINNAFLSRLEPARHLLSQVLQHRIEAFNQQLELTIREKFTSLQPSVEWKFNEVAWNYIQRHSTDPKADVGGVVFRDVYPIYGAIDIRNSSQERNAAIQKDYLRQLEILQFTLKELKQHMEMELLDEMLFKSLKWQDLIQQVLTAEDELKVNDFFENDVTPLLTHFKENNDTAGNIVLSYFKQSELFKRVINYNRNDYQESVDLINSTLIRYMEAEKKQLQKSYPNYFEKYKSDGIEYNIYIGQSIAPQKPFNLLYLKNLKLWQLSSMAAVTRLTHRLQPQLKVKLQTTQLILIHSNAIDISFRRDERRFDVEGAYNIRYEIMKKRIDKVHTTTGERLTQPGKIALVYSNQKEVQEYSKFIEYLQDQQLLKDDLEYLDLEEIQGLYGLRALRIGVNLT